MAGAPDPLIVAAAYLLEAAPTISGHRRQVPAAALAGGSNPPGPRAYSKP